MNIPNKNNANIININYIQNYKQVQKDPHQNTNLTQKNIKIEEEKKKIGYLFKECFKKMNDSFSLFKQSKIIESIQIIQKVFRNLQKLKEYIENKAIYLKEYIPNINCLLSRLLKLQSNYYIEVYNYHKKKLKYKPKDNSQSTKEYILQHIIQNTFISFNEIFEGNQENNLKNYLIYTYCKAIISKNKSLLLYGPNGCGKSISVLALAEYVNANFIQIDNINLFKIEKFALELSFLCLSNQPIILYFKNIENFIPVINHLNFIFDKLVNNNNIKNNIFIIASTKIKPEKLPKNLCNLFIYLHYVEPIHSEYRVDYIKFLSKKFNLFLNINDENLNKICKENLNIYSNEDIKNILLNKTDSQNQENGYCLTYNDLINASKLISPSIKLDQFKL